ncbi:MAG: SAM-dependent methyltransferase [Actinomycetota bacterium]|nr:SAM-dependent methyltransferase [Actinomycetota bacterium]
MNALHARLLGRIRNEGPLPFAEYMAIALYDPEHGYYSAGGERTGWRGDFVTSPELDPAFGSLWARAIEQVWDAAGRPPHFHVIEVGPGEGGFAAALLDVATGAFGDALVLTLVELSPVRRARQAARIGEGATWVEDVDEIGPVPAGFVFLNEVLDNQPVHALRSIDGVVHELHVAERDGALVEEWRPCRDEDLVARAAAAPSDAGTIEISRAAEGLATRCAALIDKGGTVFVDYGRDGAEQAGDSLVTFSSSGVDDLRIDQPGTRDITAHVDWRPIVEALERAGFETFGPHRQRAVLQWLGAGSVDDDLRQRHSERLERGQGAAAVRMLSRRHALRTLLDPGGLGRLQVVAGIKGVSTPPFLQKEEDRP